MLCSEIKVVGLNITEDFYEYKGLFDLCAGDNCFRIDLDDLSKEKVLEIKRFFNLDEPVEEIMNAIMSKLLDLASLESRNVEGTIK